MSHASPMTFEQRTPAVASSDLLCCGRPYYQDSYVTIFNAACEEIQLPRCDIFLTDPPYQSAGRLNVGTMNENILRDRKERQLIFWSETVIFPFSHTAKHRWIKPNRLGGRGYETIYERNGESQSQEWTATSINSTVAANMAQDIYTKHPYQKPIALIKKMLIYAGLPCLVIDPWMGSGATLVAAKELGLLAIGVEISEQFCEMATTRLLQGRLAL